MFVTANIHALHNVEIKTNETNPASNNKEPRGVVICSPLYQDRGSDKTDYVQCYP